MSIYSYEEAFGQADKTSTKMKQALEKWRELYYRQDVTAQADPCQRIAYTVVNKIVKTVFGEYRAYAEDKVAAALLKKLDLIAKDAMQLALVEGECYLKPYVGVDGISFVTVARSNVLVFARDADGRPVDIGTAERSVYNGKYYTLLERRQVDAEGYLTITNRLYSSADSSRLGTQVALESCGKYENLPDSFRYPLPVGSVGLVRMKTPMLNCVDGSSDGVSVYGAAVGLIENIDKNEAQLNLEFANGQSRVFASADLLRRDSSGSSSLEDTLFVGLDEDPESVGITVFSPNLREQAYLARKQEYLRNVESVIGLKRGMLSDANVEDRTATEITSSAGDFNLTVIDFQRMWQKALEEMLVLCAVLTKLYGLPAIGSCNVSVDWGNGVLYDESQTWQEYLQMVDKGLVKPEIALGWRFGLPADTAEDLAKIRKAWMPEE